MKLILKYIKPYLAAALLAPLLMLLEVIMDLMQPTFMARIVDKGIIPLDMSVVTQTGLSMLGITLIGLAGGIGCTIFSTIASTGVARDLRGALYKKVLSLSHGNIDEMETGGIITRLTNDVVRVEILVRMGLRILVRAPLQIAGSLILAILISPSLSIIFAVIIPLLILGSYLIIRKAYPLFSIIQEKMDMVNIRLQENLAGIRLVKAFVRQDLEKKKFSAANDELMENNIKAAKIVAFTQPVVMTLLNLGILAVLWFGGAHVSSGNLMIGQVIAFINYMMQLLMSLIMISHIIMNLSRSQASIKRLEELFGRESAISEIADPVYKDSIKGDVEFKNVSFSYNAHTGDPVLTNISFKVSSGEKIAILGATGSGKSTIASLIPRLYDITSGEILIDGIPVKNYSLKSLRKNIGMSPQHITLFSGSLEKNITYGNDPANKTDVKKYAAFAAIDDFIEQLPDKYETDVKQKGVNLSGGQKQRISIARALSGNPSLIILDDSTSAVDSGTETFIQSALFNLPDCTIFIIAQRISSAIKADRIILLDNGMTAGEGTHAELLETNDIYREIYHSQMGIGGSE